MKGDFSKLDFDPTDNYTGVLYQQGRVFVDTDGSTETQIESHLRTTLAQDAIGADVAAVPAAEADSFKVVQAQAGAGGVTVTVKPGRLWADGVPLMLDGTTDQTFSASYLPAPFNPTAPGAIASGVHDAVVLEVWEEAFNAFQDPLHLIEPALGGVDTTERVKVCFGLKLLRLDTGEECGNLADRLADDFAAKGKLTVTPAASTVISGDCPIDIGGGYSGFEHYLYRIEIAQPDGAGNARFKWSQFNGGLVGRGSYTSTSATTGTVAIKANNQMINHCGLPAFYLEALAYDATVGHWVVKLTASATLTQDDTLSLTGVSGTWPATTPATAFFRLWNGIELISAFPIPAMGTNPNALPNDVGIGLSFDAIATGKYLPGDYWTFPVRAAGANIDADWIAANWPQTAPPQGVHYHRVPLAILNWSGAAPVTITAPGAIIDCRRVFQPLTRLRGCCRFTVGDGMISFGDFDTIQAAINALPPAGGEICVLPGEYQENVVISGKTKITIKGCGAKSRVIPATAGTQVIRITESSHIRIEALGIVGGASSAGVRVDGRVHDHITLSKLHISAATRGAIEVMDSEFLTIEDCRIFMNDASSPWPAVYVTGEDVLVRGNEIEVERTTVAAGATSAGLGVGAVTAGRGGLQIGGTSERVRVIDNLIEGGIGNGITLGSMEAVSATGVGLGVLVGWVIDAYDPCNPCDPGDGYFPPGGGGDATTTYHSAGPLYEILIEHNRIFDMGLNGIGVVAFFDLSRQDEFISVEGLRIVDNDIRRCLRRTLAPIPAEMRNAMGYGGISLADVDMLTIHRNRIEDNGPSHLEPICGIFILHGEGVDISDNRIVNNGAKTQQPSHTAKDGRRGGINIVFAVAPTVPTPIGGVYAPVENGVPALKVHDNVVSQPLGQALSLTALGAVSVANNHLTSRGMVLKLSPMSPSFLAATVSILNLGMSNEMYWQMANFSGVLYGSVSAGPLPSVDAGVVLVPRAGLDDKRVGQYLADGNVLFTDNRCDLNLLETGVGFALSSIMIMSLDDVGFVSNQCVCNLFDDYVYVQAMLFGLSLRVADNRFTEGVANALYSGITIGLMNATTNNQSTHCLLVNGLIPSLKVDTGNRTLIGGFSAGYCDTLKAGLSTAGFAYGG